MLSKYQTHVRLNDITPQSTRQDRFQSELEIRLAVGPNASKDKEYKNPEYFCYHVDSFAEAEVELEKFRLPAPSNKRPFNK